MAALALFSSEAYVIYFLQHNHMFLVLRCPRLLDIPNGEVMFTSRTQEQ